MRNKILVNEPRYQKAGYGPKIVKHSMSTTP